MTTELPAWISADPIGDGSIPPSRVVRFDLGGVPHQAALYAGPGIDDTWQITAEVGIEDDGTPIHNHVISLDAKVIAAEPENAARWLEQQAAQHRGRAKPHLDLAAQAMRHRGAVLALTEALAGNEDIADQVIHHRGAVTAVTLTDEGSEG